MSQTPSAYRAYRDIQKNRALKKRKLYKLAFNVALDKTILVYSLFFAVFCAMMVNDLLQRYESFFVIGEDIVSQNYLMIVILLIIRPLSLSFTRSGVLFSSAEFLLSMLPYQKERLWLFCAIDKSVKFSLTIIMTAFLLGIVTPFTLAFMLKIALIIIVLQLLIVVPQWVVYQLPWYIKLLVLPVVGFFGSIGAVVSFFVSTQIYSLIGIALLLICTNVLLWKRRFNQVNWQNIIHANDLIIWKMFFISQMSKVHIKPPKRRGLFHHLVRNKRLKRPFVDSSPLAIYQRLLFLYFNENKEQVIKGLSGTLFVLVALSFQSDSMFGVGIAVSIFLYSQVAVSFFMGVFQEKLLFCLPWQMEKWKVAFLRWVYWAGLAVLVVLSVLLFLFTDSWIWIPAQLVFYALVAREFIYFMLNEKVFLLTKQFKKTPIIISLWIMLLFFSVVYSISNPGISLVVLIIIIVRYFNL